MPLSERRRRELERMGQEKTAIEDKVAYVKTQGQNRHHTCHWPGCKEQCPPAMWGCKKHWFKLPAKLRNKIWAAYVVGQEKLATPTRWYIEIAREAQKWIKENGNVN